MEGTGLTATRSCALQGAAKQALCFSGRWGAGRVSAYCVLSCARSSSDMILFNPLYLPVICEADSLTIEQMSKLRLREVKSPA